MSRSSDQCISSSESGGVQLEQHHELLEHSLNNGFCRRSLSSANNHLRAPHDPHLDLRHPLPRNRPPLHNANYLPFIWSSRSTGNLVRLRFWQVGFFFVLLVQVVSCLSEDKHVFLLPYYVAIGVLPEAPGILGTMRKSLSSKKYTDTAEYHIAKEARRVLNFVFRSFHSRTSGVMLSKDCLD